MKNETQIKNLIENWASAVRSKNIEGILAQHSKDFVMYDVPEPFQSVGLEEYRKTWDLFFQYTKPGVFDIHEINIVADENVAFAFAKMQCSDNSDGKGFAPLDFRLTIGLKKINNEWMIVHEHHSIPSK
ncbi:MAG: nuclear transport factor 2 family protein [Bacteroidetes bacterium]|nr:nuclear transport factor 2 family protein [Pseudomonadota bacterium]MBS1497538.1 nuclear transport factor 2 family protein [Bacteroidota bacterium]MBS1574639.1 nuclear transport factor 2 family protein [Bacteroidota bacterium]